MGISGKELCSVFLVLWAVGPLRTLLKAIPPPYFWLCSMYSRSWGSKNAPYCCLCSLAVLIRDYWEDRGATGQRVDLLAEESPVEKFRKESKGENLFSYPYLHPL